MPRGPDLALILAAGATLALAGCHGSLGTDVGALRVEPMPLPQRPLVYSGLIAPLRAVVDDPAAFRALWTQAFGGMQPVPPVPDVDFSIRRVVVVALGERNTGGYTIAVESAVLSGSELAIGVKISLPGNCPVTQAMSQAADFVTIPRTDNRAVKFDDHSVVQNCGP